MPSIAKYKLKAEKRGRSAANHLLFAWLCSDEHRRRLYADMISKEQALAFESRAYVDDEPASGDEDRPKKYRGKAYLIVHPAHVEAACRNAEDASIAWSHAPYKQLGGTFMLALDEPPQPGDPFLSHDSQRNYCYALLKELTPNLDAIATVAYKAGAALALKQRSFDLADLAEMVAIHYVARLFGFSQTDLPMLNTTAQAIGNGLMYVNAGRHFTTDAKAIPAAREALATLTNRAAELLDLYSGPVGKDQCDRWADLRKEMDELAGYWLEDPGAHGGRPRQLLKERGFKPLMQLMTPKRRPELDFSTTEKAIMVAGLVSGTITNLRAAVCIAVQQFFKLKVDDVDAVRKAAVKAYLKHHDANWDDLPEAGEFRAFVEEALRVNPPPPFVPRRASKDIVLEPGGQTIEAGSDMIIAVGGGSWGQGGFNTRPKPSMPPPCGAQAPETAGSNACPFSMVFGGPPESRTANQRAEYLHSCIGKDIAMYSVTYTVRQLMLLPGLTQSLDESTGRPWGLTKRAGFICERYPLEYEREKLLRQSPLQTVLQVKNPVPENAAALRQVLKFGAPFIEKVLREARHVHFASFMFLDNDSKLVLFTAYDGDFDAYIGHFAREFGPLFDRFFSHIENGPPAPIAEHAFEFVQFLRRFQQPAVGGLFFSAYPEVQVHQIQSHFNKDRQYDFFTLEGAR
jgi:hypothetical protein